MTRPPVGRFEEEGGADLSSSLFSTFGTLSVVYNMPEGRWLSEEALAARDKATDPHAADPAWMPAAERPSPGDGRPSPAAVRP